MNRKRLLFCGSTLSLCILSFFLLAIPPAQKVSASASTTTRFPAFGYILDSPTITIAGASATTSASPTTGVNTAHVSFVFNAVSGTYSTCTVQAQTSYDGVNFLNLGSAASVTATAGTVNAWDIYGQAPVTSGVTVTTPSSTAAVGFGASTEYKFSCSSYGTGAQATVKVIYR